MGGLAQVLAVSLCGGWADWHDKWDNGVKSPVLCANGGNPPLGRALMVRGTGETAKKY